MPRTLKTIPEVIVLLPSATKAGADIRRGVLRYVHRNGPWALRVVEGYQEQREFCAKRVAEHAGIVGRPYFRELIESEPHGRTPQALIDPDPSLLGRPHAGGRRAIVRCDSAAVGLMAGEYFLARKYVNFAFIGAGPSFGWSLARGSVFAETVGRHGCSCAVFPPFTEAERRDPELASRRLGDWLKALPRPVALLAATDRLGVQVINACAGAGLAVPFDVAVLGIDNDEDLCENANPPLSSILLDLEQASFEAAAKLDALMRGAADAPPERLYRPLRVVARRSTETTQIGDPLVVRALEFITLNACSGIGVPEVARHLRASRRLVEIHFRRELNTSILDEIQRIRLKRLCEQLIETNLPISQLSAMCGFASESHISNLFRRQFGCTMRAYRLSHGGDFPSPPPGGWAST